MLALLAVAAGVALLVAGAGWLVRGASRLAFAANVSPLVVGLTVVAFGTSAPELVVSVRSAIAGADEVALGNVVGSNIFNTLAILGVAALAGGLVVRQRLVRLDVPLLVAVTAGAWWSVTDGRLGVVEGSVLSAGIVVYTVFAYVVGRHEPQEVAAEYEEAFDDQSASGMRRRWPVALLLVVAGLVLLVAGAQLLVAGATELAAQLGVSDLVVGLTVVAAGTSLPELATSVVAARRGERDIAVGNVVGSNLFNLLAVLGAAGLVGGGIDVSRDMVVTDFPVVLLVTVAVLPALASGLVVRRWEGALLLAAYTGYVAHLAVGATGSPAASTARILLLAGLGILAVVFVVAGIVARRRALRRYRAAGRRAGRPRPRR
jgi:cation:H+ antiporter